MNAKKFYETKIYCCFCGKNFLISDLEIHIVKTCHPEYEYILEEKIPIPNDFQILFWKIKRGDFNFVIKPKIIQKLNQKALKKYEEFYIAVRTMKNNLIYNRKFDNLIQENFSNNEEYFIKEAVSLTLSKFDSYNVKKTNPKSKNKVDLTETLFITDFKKLICFICGVGFILNEYQKHLKCCYEDKIQRLMDDLCINSKSFILEEILKEKDKGEQADICYIFYLIKEYNKNSKIIYQKILEETEITTEIKKEELERQKQRMEELSKSISVFDERDENLKDNEFDQINLKQSFIEQPGEILLKEIHDDINLKLVLRNFLESIYLKILNEANTDFQKLVNDILTKEELEDKRYMENLKKQVKNFNQKRANNKDK
jgi:hypothetical protein